MIPVKKARQERKTQESGGFLQENATIGMKKRIIGIFGAHLLQLGIQVSIGDVTTLLLLVGGFTWSGGLALGRIQLLCVGVFTLLLGRI